MQVDDLLTFRQFSKKSADDAIDVSLNMSGHADAHIVQYDEDVGRATGSVEVREDFISNLSRISQLTGEYCHERPTQRRIRYELIGFSDPIYAEAYVKMHGLDIMLGECRGRERHMVAHLSHILGRCTTRQPNCQHASESMLGLRNTRGFETCRAGVYAIAPHGFQSIKATIKVLLFPCNARL